MVGGNSEQTVHSCPGLKMGPIGHTLDPPFFFFIYIPALIGTFQKQITAAIGNQYD